MMELRKVADLRLGQIGRLRAQHLVVEEHLRQQPMEEEDQQRPLVTDGHHINLQAAGGNRPLPLHHVAHPDPGVLLLQGQLQREGKLLLLPEV